MEIVTRTAAKALGLTRYFVGKTCVRGHVSERWVSNAHCVECLSSKAVHRRLKTRERDARRARAWRIANPVRAAENSTRWRKANPQRVKRTMQSALKKYYQKHSEKMRIRVRDYRTKHAELVKETAKRSKRKHHEKTRELRRASTAQRRARMRCAPGLGVTAADIREARVAQAGRCAYCGKRERLTLDHVVPLSKLGAHDPSNIVLACGACNSTKGDKSLVVFLAAR